MLTSATFSGGCQGKVGCGGRTYPLGLTYRYRYAGTAYTAHLLGSTRWHYFHRNDYGRGVPEKLCRGFPLRSLGRAGNFSHGLRHHHSTGAGDVELGSVSFGKAGHSLRTFLPLRSKQALGQAALGGPAGFSAATIRYQTGVTDYKPML